MDRVLIIAEAGVNHNGSLVLAKKLVDMAVEAGADAVKFQTFQAEKLVTRKAEKATYQKDLTDETETQFAMIKKLELDLQAHQKIIAHCKKKQIEFLSTAFDHDSIGLLKNLGLSTFKIPSGEITNLPYLRHIARVSDRVILSTGMATLDEVKNALKALTDSGVLKEQITVLHATTEYPCPKDEVNLNAMLTIADTFGIKVGYSDHTTGIEIPIAAVAMGATIIEKHFTLDRSLPGPDHLASIEPSELKALVDAVRNVEIAKGNGIKAPTPSEEKNLAIARKSIVAATSILQGETFTDSNLTVKRPGNGVSPWRWDEVIGSTAIRDFEPDELIEI